MNKHIHYNSVEVITESKGDIRRGPLCGQSEGASQRSPGP